MNRLDVLDAARHAQFEHGYGHVLKHGPGRRDDIHGLQRTDVLDVLGVLHGQRGNDRRCLAALAGQCLDVGLDTGAATRIMAGEDEHNRG